MCSSPPVIQCPGRPCSNLEFSLGSVLQCVVKGDHPMIKAALLCPPGSFPHCKGHLSPHLICRHIPVNMYKCVQICTNMYKYPPLGHQPLRLHAEGSATSVRMDPGERLVQALEAGLCLFGQGVQGLMYGMVTACTRWSHPPGLATVPRGEGMAGQGQDGSLWRSHLAHI